jgi:hypothetical protein
MKRLILIIALYSCYALADVESYVEVDGKEITLAGQCRCDGNQWGMCAVADRSIVKSDEEMVLCWREEGDKIIFTNSKYRFEKRLEDVKIRVTDDPFPLPASEPSSDPPPA